jgi:hypothetical protein
MQMQLNFSQTQIEDQTHINPKMISLFCGCGGLDLGFDQAGYDIANAIKKEVFLPLSKAC